MMRLQFAPLAAECALNFLGRLRFFCLANHFCLQSMAEAAPALDLCLSPSLSFFVLPLFRFLSAVPVILHTEWGNGKASYFPCDSINSHKKHNLLWI